MKEQATYVTIFVGDPHQGKSGYSTSVRDSNGRQIACETARTKRESVRKALAAARERGELTFLKVPDYPID